MSEVTVILTAYRRPEVLAEQVEAIRAQTRLPRQIWIWANDPGPAMREALGRVGVDRVVTSDRNAYVHARFALGLAAGTEFLAVFDDDTVPGPRWLENCLSTFDQAPGILGAAGVRLRGPDYGRRSVHGWHDPRAEAVEVDLVGHAWFLRREWACHLFASPAATGTNGEDIELSARAWRLAGIRSLCPPHPPGDRSLWGSLRGATLGDDAFALSRKPTHLEERSRIVRAEIAAGWLPYHRRQEAAAAMPGAPPGTGGFPSDVDEGGALPAGPSLEPGSSDAGPGDERAFLSGVQLAGRRILLFGRGIAGLGASIRGRGPALLVGVELDGTLRGPAAREIGEVHAADDEGDGPEFPDGAFDAILCPDALEHVRDPLRLLRRFRRWLAEGGQLLAAASNARRLEVVEGLISGRWVGARGRPAGRRAGSTPGARSRSSCSAPGSRPRP
ncbi:methyltransferase domain-containing protein [Singulisphaera sp. PoT]|uniref:methyltransferase domain-containing protein n=1 Tax=Singulisphaera sp. PoT TaxID=3411797 RepID=UPI003BF5A486